MNHFVTYNCKDVVDNGTFFIIEGDKPLYPGDGYCRAMATTATDQEVDYTVRATLLNIYGQYSTFSFYGHPGILLNAQDPDNFDYIFFR